MSATSAQSVAIDQRESAQGATQEKSAADQTRPAAAREEEQETTPHYRPDCRRPTNHEEADFCQQERAADAAWEAARVSGGQNWVLWSTLVAALLALIAAFRSANAAHKTLRVLERPYLSIKTDPVRPKGEPFDWTKDATYRIVNHGRTHAVVTHYFVGIEPMWSFKERGCLDPEKTLGETTERGLIIPPDGESEPFEPFNWLREGDPSHDFIGQGGYLHGLIRYEDAFGNPHVFGFVRLYSETQRRFYIPSGIGDKNANYSRSDKAATRLAKLPQTP